jgi:hypothetical protein
MTVGGENGIFHVHMIDQILDFCSVFVGETISCGIGDVYHRSSRIDNCLYYACKIFVLCTSGIFGVKFDVIHKISRIFYGFDRPFKNFLTIGVEFIFDV